MCPNIFNLNKILKLCLSKIYKVYKTWFDIYKTSALLQKTKQGHRILSLNLLVFLLSSFSSYDKKTSTNGIPPWPYNARNKLASHTVNKNK